MDEQANTLLNALKRSAAPIDQKLALFEQLKSTIKHQRVPESAQPATVECIRLAVISQTSSSLVQVGLSTLSHLIKRLSLQDQLGAVFAGRSNIVAILLEKLGDAREPLRTAAFKCLCDIWPARQADVEKAVRESAIQGQNSRAKEMGMQWVTKMHNEQGLQFRGFVAAMVACLEDADGTVRESAKVNIIELFRTAKESAKADLKRQLIIHNVRKSITTHILSQLQMAVPAELGMSGIPTDPGPRHEQPSKETYAVDRYAEKAPPEVALPPSAAVTAIEPLYVYTSRELEDIFVQMHPAFEDKESEDNWKARDKNVLKLRRLLKGNAPQEHRTTFVNGVKNMLDGILKVVNSLRTTVSTSGCSFIQELAQEFGPALDPVVEIILRGLEKMCASTKNISAENGNATVDAVLSHASYSLRVLQHVWAACQDKNVQPRTFAAGWLRTILKKAAAQRHHFETTGGLELADKCIRKCLSDANPNVRGSWRSTYWRFAREWPERGAFIMSTLDAKSQTLLEQHPDNPDPKAAATGFSSSVGPGTASRGLTSSTSRPSLKETIAKQKAMAKKIPDRPNSAMSAFSPIKEEHPPSARRAPIAQPQSSSSRVASGNTTAHPLSRATAASSSSSTGQGSLMAAPVRRPRRPEVARPATAEPYAEQKMTRPATPGQSPVASPRIALKSSVSNMGSSHVKSHSTTSSMIPTANGSPHSSRGASPRTTPIRAKPRSSQNTASPTFTTLKRDFKSSSPQVQDETMTMVMPVKQVQEASHPQLLRSPVEDDMQQADVMSNNGYTTLTTQATPDNRMDQSQSSFQTTPLDSKISVGDHEQAVDIPDRLPQNTEPGISPKDEEHDAEQRDGSLMVYEDPSEEPPEEPPAKAINVPVLEELSLNKQIQVVNDEPQIQHQETVVMADERSVSPSKKIAGAPVQERTDINKSRRLLISGTERVRQRRLDAHGFRRLHELVKNNTEAGNAIFIELFSALLEYIETPGASLGVPAATAHGLKAQALSTVRLIISQWCEDELIRQRFPRALCSLVIARREYDRASHVAMDLERTAGELITFAAEQLASCTDAVLGLAEHERATPTPPPAHRRIITMALNTLSKTLSVKGFWPSEEQRARMGSLAVRFLADIDLEVRKADTEFCVAFHGLFGTGESEQKEFWRCLKGAGDNQMNLIAYYLCKRGRTAQVPTN